MRHAVILAGGIGERFWPLSRRNRPKQFLPLGGDVSLLRATFDRLLPVVPAERIWVVTSASQARGVRRELPELSPDRILKEPRGRNTAPAVYLATLAASRVDPKASLVVVPSDAWVPRPAPYRRALKQALAVAERHQNLALIGIRPTRVETGYRHIEPGEALASGPAMRVKRFIEKPSPARARRLTNGGRHLWNCGIFAWSAPVLREEMERHLPDLVRAFAPLETGPWNARRLGKAYDAAKPISIDYGILEKSRRVAVVPADFAWDDLGSWRALERLGKNGSFEHGTVIRVDAPGGIVWAESGVVAVLGVKDVVVVHTPDATLVVAKERAQEVRALVELLSRSPKGRGTLEA